MKTLESYIELQSESSKTEMREVSTALLFSYGMMLNDLSKAVSDLQEVTRQQHATFPAIENDRLDSVVTEMNCRCKVCITE